MPFGVDLVRLPNSEVGLYWPFVETVDTVVEEDVIDVEVAADRVDKMIAADREGVAVAGDHPHAQFGIGTLDSGRDRRCAAVNAVKPVGVHVVGEA